MNLPPGYEERSVGDTTGFAWAAVAPWLESLIAQGVTLHSWAAGRPGAKTLVGRGPLHAIDAPSTGPDGRARWAVRRYHRGGFVAPLLGQRYLRSGTPRPVAELKATVEARGRGVRAPAVVAGAIYRVGPFYRADLVTELIPDARTLEALLFGGGKAADGSDALRRAGRLVRALEDASVLHVDLNAANILMAREEHESEASVVDLDRCKVLPLGGPRVNDIMMRRLERSLRKLESRYGRHLSGVEWKALRSGHEGSA